MSGVMPDDTGYELYHHCPEMGDDAHPSYVNFEGQYCYLCKTKLHKDHDTVEVRPYE